MVNTLKIIIADWTNNYIIFFYVDCSVSFRVEGSAWDTTIFDAAGARRLCRTAISDFSEAKQFCKCERFFPAGVDVRCNSSFKSDSLSSKEASVEEPIDFGDVQRESDADCRPDDDLAALARRRLICSKLFFNAIFIS